MQRHSLYKRMEQAIHTVTDKIDRIADRVSAAFYDSVCAVSSYVVRSIRTARRDLGRRQALFGLQTIFFTLLVTAAVTAVLHMPDTPVAATPAPAQSSQSTSTGRLGSTLQFGLYMNAPTPTQYEQELGVKLGIIGWFSHWNTPLANNKLRYACSEGYVPAITWESWDGAGTTGNPYPLQAIAHGDYDTLIRQDLEAVAATCKGHKVIIRFDHEMDVEAGKANWYPWQGDPTDYVAAWQHVVAMGRSIDPNILWLWSPNRGTTATKQYYPGNQWVDYVGLTLNRGTAVTQYQSFAQFYDASKTVLEAFGKPMIISETTSTEQFGDKAAWVTNMFETVEQDHQIDALIWFNETPDYSFDSSPAVLKAFQTALAHIAQGDQ